MRNVYSHTQTSSLMRYLMLAASVSMLGGAVAGGPCLALMMIPVALIIAGVGWLFSSLTVDVTGESLTWFFGPGFWRNTLPLGDITRAEAVENSWWWGWGIHCTPRGWLYNVSGLRGVEITRRDGTTLRIGSDEPEALAAALGRREA